ncbi:U4/U6-U5 snRNP complex subunit PRP38 [Saccharomyces paradoxus]|uniref:Pre-mRNA-splicing factor 38 n=1 Tax=Saccharomyces paradoxus TaxID=27291 RepID=A0A8B8URP8_SACPA|nr:Prp38 [Saccharomyces paradoxus]QHS73386.1 Prp38 [Saccharomyces paradoxus]
MAINEFQVESHISPKQLNNQSVSLIIPRLTRDKIHNSMYYKVNLSNESMRGNTMVELLKVIICALGTVKGLDGHLHMTVLGGIEFKCILMKLIEIRPNLQQLNFLLNVKNANNFDSKYIIALLLVYVRLQYYYLNDNNNDNDEDGLIKLFKVQLYKYSQQYFKLKSFPLHVDCFAHSYNEELCIIHIDELIDWLVTQDHIWGIPLGKCQSWNKIYSSDEESSSSESESNSDSESDSDSEDDSGTGSES